MSTTKNTLATVHEFFDRYAAALLARDERVVAAMYAIPSLILFPGQSIAVTDSRQTEEFFATAWAQYQGINEIEKRLVIMDTTPHSVWVDVTWFHHSEARERFCYQLITRSDGYQIAVLTPLPLALT